MQIWMWGVSLHPCNCAITPYCKLLLWLASMHSNKHTRTQSDILTFSLRWLCNRFLCICHGCELIYRCTFAMANVWNCSPMSSKETQRCWDSLARWKRWSDMRETMLRRVRCANTTAYRLGTSQLGLYPTHSAQMHCSILQGIIFQRIFMFTIEKHCWDLNFWYSDV